MTWQSPQDLGAEAQEPSPSFLLRVRPSEPGEVVLPLTCMDAQGQGEAEAAVQKLRADGQTNLWQGQGWGSHQPQNPGRALCSLSKLLPGL